MKIQLSGNHHDIYYYSALYKNCEKSTDVEQIYNLIENKLQDNTAKQLNIIAKSIAWDKFGLHNKSLDILKSIDIKSNSIPLIIKIEYYSALGTIAMRNEDPNLSVKHMKTAISLID